MHIFYILNVYTTQFNDIQSACKNVASKAFVPRIQAVRKIEFNEVENGELPRIYTMM